MVLKKTGIGIPCGEMVNSSKGVVGSVVWVGGGQRDSRSEYCRSEKGGRVFRRASSASAGWVKGAAGGLKSSASSASVFCWFT